MPYVYVHFSFTLCTGATMLQRITVDIKLPKKKTPKTHVLVLLFRTAPEVRPSAVKLVIQCDRGDLAASNRKRGR